MTELWEGLRGPALGLVFVIIVLAGMIATAAFAALVAQMGLLLRLRSRDHQPQPADSPAARSRQSTSYSVHGSPRASVNEPKIQERNDSMWWPEVE